VTRARLWLAVALFGALAAGVFVGAATDVMWRSSEERCVSVVTAMVQSGDWLVPRIDGALRLQKPPLYYWIGASAVQLTGGPVLTTLRRVSGIAALALAAAVFAVGYSLGGYTTALASTFALAATALFYIRGRVGDAEMVLALLVFLALAVFERLWRTRDRRLLPPLALLVGLAFLTKATAALLCIFVPIALWLALERNLSLALRPAVFLWAAVALAISLSWYGLIFARVPGATELFRDYLLNPFGVHSTSQDAIHARSLFFYLPRFPLNAAPAGLLFPWLGYEAWKRRFWRDEPRMRFLALAFVSQICAWSLVPSKQIHYLLPMVPLQALLLGRLAAQRFLAPRDEAKA
jgi:4-amino-4-deoxy-L-arabinose transferase-like glycosyltransferase